MKSRRAAALFLYVFLSLPFLMALSDPAPSEPPAPLPSGSASASPPRDVLSAALFSGTSKAPPEEAWKNATLISGIRIGADAVRHSCDVRHIAEWVRVECDDMRAARVDILAGEKRDFTVIGSPDGYHGEKMSAQFSMRPGDRRIIQWIMSDTWSEVWPGDNGEWMSGGPQSRGPMLGVAVQVDWASGPEPILSIF